MLEALFVLLLSFSPEIQKIVSYILTGGITIAYLILIGFGISSALKFQQKQLPFIGFLAVRLREMVDSRRK